MNAVEVEHGETIDKAFSTLSIRSIDSLQMDGDLAD